MSPSSSTFPCHAYINPSHTNFLPPLRLFHITHTSAILIQIFLPPPLCLFLLPSQWLPLLTPGAHVTSPARLRSLQAPSRSLSASRLLISNPQRRPYYPPSSIVSTRWLITISHTPAPLWFNTELKLGIPTSETPDAQTFEAVPDSPAPAPQGGPR